MFPQSLSLRHAILFILLVLVSFSGERASAQVVINDADIPMDKMRRFSPPPTVAKQVPKLANSLSERVQSKGIKGLVNNSGVKTAPPLNSFSAHAPSTGDAGVDTLVREAAARHNVDPLLIFAIMRQESSFKKRAVSPKGASGLMQLMPATALRFGVTNIFDARQNIEAGTRYMRWLLDCFGGDVRLALAGYNAGEGAVMKYGRQIPPYIETQQYVQRISAHYAALTGRSDLVAHVLYTQPVKRRTEPIATNNIATKPVPALLRGINPAKTRLILAFGL